MRLLTAGTIWGVGTLVLFAACAFPDFQFDQEGTGGGSSTSSSGGGTGGTHTGGTGGSSTGEAGSGGSQSCELYELGGCNSNEKCTIVNVDTGEIGCGLAGTKEIWERCNGDGDCVAGTWCDQLLHVCKPWCQNITECVFDGGTFEGECITARRPDGSDIPGNPSHCVPNCDPISGAPCVTADSVTCIFIGGGSFDCAHSENHTSGYNCTTSEDCAAGLLCTGSGIGTCRYWCTPPAFLGCGLSNCSPLDPKVFYNAAEYGACG